MAGRLSDGEVLEIARLLGSGLTHGEVAVRSGRSEGIIHLIFRRFGGMRPDCRVVREVSLSCWDRHLTQ